MLGYVLPVITLALGIFIGARLGEVPTLDDARRAADAAGAMAIDWTSRSIQRMRNAVTASQADADGGIAGQARVIDGDTLDIRGTRIRLHGIDAPESRQMCRAAGRYWSCGQQASRALAELIGPRRVVCSERGRDRYGRIVAVCLAGRTDLNRWMVAKGWAFAYRQYARLYVADEMAARAAGRGIWRGDAVPPWDWRRGERLPGVSSGSSESRAAVEQAAGKCAIKGNISSNDRRIYHVPGGRYYDQTRINTARGERWFCSEREARAAGWHRSGK